MTAKRKGNVNRLLDPRWASAREAGWKLWDRDGRLWGLHAENLDRMRVSILFYDPDADCELRALGESERDCRIPVRSPLTRSDRYHAALRSSPRPLRPISACGTAGRPFQGWPAFRRR